jgi:hypothetical protein
VVVAVSLSGKERNRAFEELRKNGIYKTNQEAVKSGNTTSIMRERKILDSQAAAKTKMCGSCKGFYSKTSIWKHMKTCKGSGSGPNIAAIPVTLLSSIDDETDATFSINILPAFQEGPVGDLCRTDWMIQMFGSHQWAKNVKEDKKGPMTDMRRLAHLILHCREVLQDKGRTTEEFHGVDLFNRRKFDIINQALVNYTTEGEKSKASLKIGTSYLLKSAGDTLRAVYLIREEDDKAEEVRKFLDILANKWKSMTNKAVHQVQMRSQELSRRPVQLPLDEDIKCLKDYTLLAMDHLLSDIDKIWSTGDFNQLRTLLVCRLTMFNARRGGEAARLLLKDWFDAESDAWIDPKAAKNLSPADQLLLGDYKLTYMPGKGRKLVPVLIPEDLVPGIQKLVGLRKDISINPKNKYLFAATRGSTMHVYGNQCIAAVCAAAGVMNAERMTGAQEESRVTATKIRHRASTLYVALDVPEKDRQAFYKHMGHSAEINADVYTCPEAIREILVVGKHLGNMDNIECEGEPKQRDYKIYV